MCAGVFGQPMEYLQVLCLLFHKCRGQAEVVFLKEVGV